VHDVLHHLVQRVRSAAVKERLRERKQGQQRRRHESINANCRRAVVANLIEGLRIERPHATQLRDQGDLFMTLIHTCQLCGANSFDYLTELQRHAKELAANPAEWMPWNFRETLVRTAGV